MTYTPLVGPIRIKWIEEQYARYRKRRTALAVLGVVGLALLVSWSYVGNSLLASVDGGIRSGVNLAVLVVALVSFAVPFTQLDSVGKLLPPVEDRVLYLLTPTIVNIKAYVTNWDDADRKKTLKNLEKISGVLEAWDIGNLKFVKDTVGKTVEDLKKNFRGRAIPVFRKAPEIDRDKQKNRAVLIQIWLSNVQNQLEMGQLQELHVKGWNDYLTQIENPNDLTSQPLFPYQKQKPGRLSWLKSKWFHVIFLAGVLLVPTIVYSVTVNTQLASKDAAFGGSIAVGVALIGAYVAFMTLGRKRANR